MVIFAAQLTNNRPHLVVQSRPRENVLILSDSLLNIHWVTNQLCHEVCRAIFFELSTDELHIHYKTHVHYLVNGKYYIGKARSVENVYYKQDGQYEYNNFVSNILT